jgi:phosphatidylglycerophosphate synthase
MIMMILKFIPNFLSISRGFCGVLVYYSAVHKEWPVALLYHLIGLATDWLDGFLAIKLDAKSKIGEKYLDRFGDLFLTVGSWLGLVLSQVVDWRIIYFLVPITIIIWTPRLMKSKKISLVCEGISPFFYLAILFISTGFYLFKVLGAHTFWLMIVSLPLGLVAALYKSHRIKTWLGLIKTWFNLVGKSKT